MIFWVLPEIDACPGNDFSTHTLKKPFLADILSSAPTFGRITARSCWKTVSSTVRTKEQVCTGLATSGPRGFAEERQMEGRVHTCHVTAPSGLFHLLTLLTELLLSAGACYFNGIASREVPFCLRWAFFFFFWKTGIFSLHQCPRLALRKLVLSGGV